MNLPRVGFLGTGWIGRGRMEAICRTGVVTPVAISDPDPECAAAAHALAPDARVLPSLESMLASGLDGVVIATPSALHATQAIAALGAGVAVFCQKPLGRDGAETRRVIAAARAADRLLGVDFSYRRSAAAEALKAEVASGSLGRVYAFDLTFHNAYGPGKAWFFDRALAGGGCVMDLGVHLVDLLLWVLDDAGIAPEVTDVRARLFSGGGVLQPGGVEDYAAFELDLAGGAAARIACSWNLHAGRDAVIEVTFHGTRGAVSMRNLAGSFYDFEALRLEGTACRVLAAPPDAWGGRVAADWARRLGADARFDPAVTRCADVADVLDQVYAAGARTSTAGADEPRALTKAP